MTRRVLALCALLVMPAATASATPFTNGSFELASINPGAGFITLGAGSTAITGWEVFGTSVDYIGTFWEAADGVRSVDLNGGAPGGGVRQTFDTIAGESYRIDFALAGNPDGPPDLKRVLVESGSFSGSFDFLVLPSTSRTDMDWSYRSLVFTAASSSTTLSFLSTIGTAGAECCYGPVVDDVSVNLVPEPATLSLLGLGLAAAARRRFRRR